MPNSQDYQVFEVPYLVGGLARHLTWRQMPPTHWYKARGFVVNDGALVTMEGYENYVTDILSPEYQDYFDSGAVYIHGRIVGVADYFYVHNEIDWAVVLRDVTDWECKLEKDSDTLYTALIQETHAGTVGALLFAIGAPYQGELFWLGSSAEPLSMDHPKRGYTCRLETPLVGTEQQNCPIIGIRWFQEEPGTNHLYACTTRDIYEYDAGAMGQSERITQVCTTGTAKFEDGGADKVVGTATKWDTAIYPGPGDGIEADQLIKADAHADSAWTRIKTVDDDTHITLAEDYRGAGTVGAVNYTIIKTYLSGPVTLDVARRYRWSTTGWKSGEPGKMWIATNGYDHVQKFDHYTPGTVMEDLGGLDDGAFIIGETPGVDVKSANVAITFMESLCLGGLREKPDGGSTTYEPLRIRWSDPRDAETYTPYKRRDLEGDDEIKNAKISGNTCVWLTTHGIHNQNFAASPIDFSFVRKASDIGTVAPGTMQTTGDGFIRFLSGDDLFAYDKVRTVRFGLEVRDLIFNTIIDEYASLAEAHYDPINAMYLISVPQVAGGSKWNYITLAYDLRTKTWTGPFDGFMCFGHWYETEAIPVIDEYTNLINSYTGPYDQRVGADTPVLLSGGRNGQLYKMFSGWENDRQDPDAEIIFGMTDLGRPGMKRLGWLTFTHKSGSHSASIYVGLSRDGRNVYEWVGPLYYPMAEVDGEDRKTILTVDRSANWFAFKIAGFKRNQPLEFEAIQAHFRLEGRG